MKALLVGIFITISAILMLSCNNAQPSSTTGGASSLSGISSAAAKSAPSKTPIVLSKTSRVKLFLVAVGDDGNSGKRIGCNDSLVAVERSIQPTPAPLKSSLEELLSTPESSDSDGRTLVNYWKGTALSLNNVELKNGVATIEIKGQLSVAGICDEPRIVGQIEATAKQFPTVRSVRVTVNGTALADAIR